MKATELADDLRLQIVAAQERIGVKRTKIMRQQALGTLADWEGLDACLFAQWPCTDSEARQRWIDLHAGLFHDKLSAGDADFFRKLANALDAIKKGKSVVRCAPGPQGMLRADEVGHKGRPGRRVSPGDILCPFLLFVECELAMALHEVRVPSSANVWSKIQSLVASTAQTSDVQFSCTRHHFQRLIRDHQLRQVLL